MSRRYVRAPVLVRAGVQSAVASVCGARFADDRAMVDRGVLRCRVPLACCADRDRSVAARSRGREYHIRRDYVRRTMATVKRSTTPFSRVLVSIVLSELDFDPAV